MDIKKELISLEDELIKLRRDFHKHPELGFNEFRTAGIVANYLRDCGLKVKEKVAKTGIVALLCGREPGRTLMLRADMDALPIQERNDVSYKSVNNGVMHACGHDGHTAILLITAKILSRHSDEFKGNIKFVFQPNEETAGARLMIEEGVLKDPVVDAAFAIHLWTPIENGKIGICSGVVMGGQYEFRLIIKGKGGHTSSPHLSIDPIIAASDIVNSVQRIQTREIDPLKQTVIMFGKIAGGTASNIIPEEVELNGIIRYLYKGGDDSEERPHKRFERIINGVCEIHQTEYELEYTAITPPLYNDPGLVQIVELNARSVFGKENILQYVSLAGEDFSEFSMEIPSSFYFIGTGNKEKESNYPHHHPRFNIDEDTLLNGVEMHIRTALAYLNN
jgi:amidohydrolase